MTRRAVLAGGLLAALLFGVPTYAASRTVSLTATGPKPPSLTLVAGQRVVFVNNDTVPHEVKSQGAWQYDSGPLPPGRSSAPTPALTAPGTYPYTDTRGIVVLPQTFHGALVVPKPKPKPKPGPSPTPSPTRTQSATPSPTASPPAPLLTPTAAPPSPTAGATPSPSPSPTRSAVVRPTPGPSSPAPEITYGDQRALTQGSPHRFGLPALLGLVGIGGVLSLLGRYLLSLPEGRRTDRW